ncbi:MAG: gamma-glutamyltransferase [Mycobacteriales bacterium]
MRIALAASNTLAIRAGLGLAEAGGNAVDVAISAMLVAMVCEPGICSPAGGAFVTVAPADETTPVTFDGNVEMPGRGVPREQFDRGLREVTMTYGGGVTTTIGHGSVATPGAIAALDLAHRRYGSAPWSEVVAPAVTSAREGFPLGSASAYYLGHSGENIYGWHADSHAALHHPDGRLFVAGDVVRIPYLADTLQLIADEGSAAFYRGDIAKLIAADMAEHGGLLTEQDLASYRVEPRDSLRVQYGDWTLGINPPPSIGGPVLAAMLTLMAGRPDGAWQPEDVAMLVAVQEAVLRYRLEHLDITADRQAAAQQLMDLVRAEGIAGLGGAPSTVHISAVDEQGCACAITASTGYGSGVMTPGTGLWLNNCLGEPELNRGGMHALAPGERLASNMAPTVGRSTDGSVLAVGSPGADRITTALLQVLAGFAGGGMDLATAVAHPRLHVRTADGAPVVEHEDGVALPPLPWPTRSHGVSSMYFGGVAAALLKGDGSLHAAADPRRDGCVAVS